MTPPDQEFPESSRPDETQPWQAPQGQPERGSTSRQQGSWGSLGQADEAKYQQPTYGQSASAGGYGPPAPPAGAAAGGPSAADQWRGMTPEQVSRMYQPGVVPLRPLTLSDIYDGTFQTLRRNPRATWGMAAIVMAVVTIAGVLASSLLLAAPGMDFDIALNLSTVLSAPFTLVGVMVLAGLMSYVVSRAAIGEKVGLSQSWQQVKGRIWPLIGLALINGLIISATFLPALVILIVGLATGDGGVIAVTVGISVLTGFLGFVAAVFFATKLALGTPVIVLEGVGPIKAIKRSWHLTSSAAQFWRIFGITFLTGVIVAVLSYIIALAIGLPTTLFFASFGSESTALVGIVAFSALANYVAYVVTAPFQSSVTALLYVDQRIRREGLHVQMQQAAKNVTGADPSR